MTLAQVWVYDRGAQKGFSTTVVGFVVLQWLIAMGVFAVEGLIGIALPTVINTFLVTGYMKTLITFFKY